MEKDYHVSEIKGFLHDTPVGDPVDVAHHYHMEFFVKSISIIELFKLVLLQSFEFGNSWGPYSSLLDVVVLQNHFHTPVRATCPDTANCLHCMSFNLFQKTTQVYRPGVVYSPKRYISYIRIV